MPRVASQSPPDSTGTPNDAYSRLGGGRSTVVESVIAALRAHSGEQRCSHRLAAKVRQLPFTAKDFPTSLLLYAVYFSIFCLFEAWSGNLSIHNAAFRIPIDYRTSDLQHRAPRHPIQFPDPYEPSQNIH